MALAEAEPQPFVGGKTNGGPTVGLPPGSNAPAVFQTMRWVLRPIPFMRESRDRYGDIFTVKLPIGPAVFIADPAVVKEVFQGDAEIFKAGEINSVPLRPLLGPNSVLTLDGPEHMRERKLMLPAFHGERMRSYGNVMQEATERSLASWPTDSPFAIHPRMQDITLDVIMRAVFGIEEGERMAKLSTLLKQVLDTISQSRMRLPVVMLVVLTSRFNWRPKIVQNYVGRVDEMLYEEIAQRRKASDLSERDDILSLLLQARYEDGSQMSDSQLRDELMTLLLAGHETTATALAWTFDLLLHSPAVMARLTEELDSGREDYLEAVIKEALRLRPVIPAVGRRMKEERQIGDYLLPEDTLVVPNIYLTDRNPKTYPEPDRFIPERFLDNPPDTYSWIPFGGGVRRCIGASFAMYEMKVVLKAILSEARLSAANPALEHTTRRTVTLSPRQGTEVIFHGLTGSKASVAA